MLTNEMQAALNEQLNLELVSGYLYLAMSAFAESRDLPGASHWLRMQALEEARIHHPARE